MVRLGTWHINSQKAIHEFSLLINCSLKLVNAFEVCIATLFIERSIAFAIFAFELCQVLLWLTNIGYGDLYRSNLNRSIPQFVFRSDRGLKVRVNIYFQPCNRWTNLNFCQLFVRYNVIALILWLHKDRGAYFLYQIGTQHSLTQGHGKLGEIDITSPPNFECRVRSGSHIDKHFVFVIPQLALTQSCDGVIFGVGKRNNEVGMLRE